MATRISALLTAAALSVICSATLFATIATRVTSPVYIVWLTTSVALFYICLCFVVSLYLRHSLQRLEADGQADNAVLHGSAAVEAGNEDPQQNTYSLSTFYWCSPGLQNNTATLPVSSSRTAETVIHKPLQSSSGLLTTAMESSPMPPGLPPGAYFDSSDTYLQRASQLSAIRGETIQVPLPTYQRR